MNVLFNFTLGVCGAVIAFIFRYFTHNSRIIILDFVLHIFHISIHHFVFTCYSLFLPSLYSLIQSYRESLLLAAPFFLAASLAAISFALTWLITLYFATAGTVYVGAKFIASNMRLEDGQRGAGPRGRVRYD